MPFQVLIPQDVSETGKQYLLERGYQLRVGTGIEPDTLKRELQACDALLLRTAILSEDVLQAAPRLRVISKHGVGVDNVDLAAASRLGIRVTNAPESNASTVAEHTLGLMIALARNIVAYDKRLRTGGFEIRHQYGMDLAGKTLGIIGLGQIGRMVAKKATFGLDMKVIGYDPYVTEMPEPWSFIRCVDTRDQVLSEADFVCLHTPLTESTRRSIGAPEFKLMKPSAYLVNAARGELVDETALVEALQTGIIAGAGLDVFELEPPDRSNPLFQLEQVVVSPHNAALTHEATDRMSLHAAIGIDEVLSGKEPTWPVRQPELMRRSGV